MSKDSGKITSGGRRPPERTPPVISAERVREPRVHSVRIDPEGRYLLLVTGYVFSASEQRLIQDWLHRWWESGDRFGVLALPGVDMGLKVERVGE